MRLSDLFLCVAAKRLRAVEAEPARSNQHEFNGVTALRNMLGDDRRTLAARFILLGDDESPLACDGSLTWYDARERHATRTEYRLYFPPCEVMTEAREGDMIVFGLREDGSMLVIIGAAGTTGESQLSWLFGLSPAADGGYAVASPELLEQDIGFAGSYILEELGVEIAAAGDDGQLEHLLSTFGSAFPPTAVFSTYARDSLPHVSSLDDPDGALVAWFEQEERLFRMFERHLVAQRLREGFGEDVDAFTGYALSVLNRRKARAGKALENHVEQVLKDWGVPYTRECRTENNSKPDFIFPGCSEYHQTNFPQDQLRMLAVKSTCKDRWRQVLAEAARVSRKHLLTLEPGISVQQTTEMVDHAVQLVIPRGIQSSFQDAQREELISLGEFVGMAQANLWSS